MIENSFFDDYEKMQDFRELSKTEFLASYSYLNEAEYEATVRDVSARLAEFMPVPADSIAKQIENYGAPQILEDYTSALKASLNDPYTFYGDVAAECRAKDLLTAINKNAPFDYSRVQFQDDIMYDTDMSKGEDNPRSTVDMELWLTDRQYKELLDKIDFSNTELSGSEEELKKEVGQASDSITVNAYAVIGIEGDGLYRPETTLGDANVSINVSISVEAFENGSSVTKNYVSEIPVVDTDKYNLLSVMESYSQSKLNRPLIDLMSEAKENTISELGLAYKQTHHVDGLELAQKIAEFTYDFDPYAAQDNISSVSSTPKATYTEEMVSAFQSDPAGTIAAFTEFYDEEMKASFSDEQRATFSTLVLAMDRFMTDPYRGFEYNSYISGGLSENEHTEFEFTCPDSVLQEYANRIPSFHSISGSKDINAICREDDVTMSVKVSVLPEGDCSITLQKDGWEYGRENYNIPLSDAEKQQFKYTISQIQHEILHPQKTWSDVMNDTLTTAHVEVFNTIDVLSNTQLSLPQLNRMFDGALNLSDETVMNEPLSDFRNVAGIEAVRQLIETYPVCVVDTLYSGDDKFNHIVGLATNDPMQVIEVIDSRLTDYYEKDMRAELNASGLNIDTTAFESYDDYIDLGNRLKDGTADERAFFKAHEQDFATFDLVATHIQEVDMKDVIHKTGNEYGEKADSTARSINSNIKRDYFER